MGTVFTALLAGLSVGIILSLIAMVVMGFVAAIAWVADAFGEGFAVLFGFLTVSCVVAFFVGAGMTAGPEIAEVLLQAGAPNPVEIQ